MPHATEELIFMDKHEFGKKTYLEVTSNGEKLNKWLTLGAIERHDLNGNLIYYFDDGLLEEWREFDSHNNIIKLKDSDENEIISTNDYNDDGRLIHSEKTENGNYESETWIEYDSSGNKIHEKDSNNYETWFDYDSAGLCIHSKDSNGVETWMEYGSNDKRLHSKNSKNFERFWEYDEFGNFIHYKDNDTEFWFINELFENKKPEKVYIYKAI